MCQDYSRHWGSIVKEHGVLLLNTNILVGKDQHKTEVVN